MRSILSTAGVVAGLQLQSAVGSPELNAFPLSSRRPGALLTYEFPSAPPQFYYTTSDIKSDNWIGFFPKGVGPGKEGDSTCTGWKFAPGARGTVTADNDYDLCTPKGEYEAYFFSWGDRSNPIAGPSPFTYPGDPNYKRCGDGKCVRSTATCGCGNDQKLCDGKCIDSDAPCDGRCDDGQKKCNGKCLSTDLPCNGQCIWGKRQCNGRCINADLPCNGQCVDGQKACSGKCIVNDAPCEGQCGQGKKVCGNKCISNDSTCNGQCNRGEKACNDRCIKASALCCPDGQKDCHGRCIRSSSDCKARTCGLHAGDSVCSSTRLIREVGGYFTPEKCAMVCRSEPECKASAAAADFNGGCWLYREDLTTCAGQPGSNAWIYSDRDCYPLEPYTPVCGLDGSASPCTFQAEEIRHDAGSGTPEQCGTVCKSVPECKSYAVGANNNNGCWLYRENLGICRGRPGSGWKYSDRDC